MSTPIKVIAGSLLLVAAGGVGVFADRVLFPPKSGKTLHLQPVYIPADTNPRKQRMLEEQAEREWMQEQREKDNLDLALVNAKTSIMQSYIALAASVLSILGMVIAYLGVRSGTSQRHHAREYLF